MSRLIFSIMSVALALAACAHSDNEKAAHAEPSRLVALGRSIAETRCVSCHAIGETGESRNPEAPPLRTLSERYPVNALEEAFAEGVLVGHPSMPEFRFEPRDIDALLAYLESIQTHRGG
jgi:mono/diheme cytochrome c family protein